MSELREIVDKLTEAQRKALLEAHDIGFALITRGDTQRSAKALHRRGLTNLAWSPSGLTPLGLRVRQLLQGERDNG